MDIVAAITADGITFTQEYFDFAAVIAAYGKAIGQEETATGYLANSYAMAGYIAGMSFCEGIDRVCDDVEVLTEETLTWESYIAAMESAPVTVGLTKGATVDLAEGSRIGMPALSLMNYISLPDPADAEKVIAYGMVLRGLTDLADIEKAYNDAK